MGLTLTWSILPNLHRVFAVRHNLRGVPESHAIPHPISQSGIRVPRSGPVRRRTRPTLPVAQQLRRWSLREVIHGGLMVRPRIIDGSVLVRSRCARTEWACAVVVWWRISNGRGLLAHHLTRVTGVNRIVVVVAVCTEGLVTIIWRHWWRAEALRRRRAWVLIWLFKPRGDFWWRGDGSIHLGVGCHFGSHALVIHLLGKYRSTNERKHC